MKALKCSVKNGTRNSTITGMSVLGRFGLERCDESTRAHTRMTATLVNSLGWMASGPSMSQRCVSTVRRPHAIPA